MDRINTMCIECIERGKSCGGTTCQTWTGCVYRKASIDCDNSYIPIMSREDLLEKGVLVNAITTPKRRLP